MADELKKKPATQFLIVVSGSSSAELLEKYSKSDTVNPCQILVYCKDVPKWKKHWQHSEHVRVSSDMNEAVEFCEPKKYDIKKDAFVPLREYSVTYRQGIKDGKTIYYQWRQIDNGVLFAGAGSYSYYVEEGWLTCE